MIRLFICKHTPCSLWIAIDEKIFLQILQSDVILDSLSHLHPYKNYTMPLKGMSSFSMLSWQLTLTAEALGLDSNIALELILMITNIQTLGVPIRYAPIPASISAFFGLLFIPILGIVTDRWAKSKTSKANILIMTACVLLTGSLSVLTANALKLFYCNTNTQGDYDHRNHTAELHSSTINFTRSSPRAAHLIAFSNGSVGASLDYLVQKHVNSSVLFNYSEQNIYQHISAVDLGITQPSRMTVSNSSGNKIKSTPFYAYIAMVGYGLMDAGHDLGGCFLKTFVLHCTPPAYQTGVLVKLIFISSVGKLFTLLHPLVIFVKFSLRPQ